MLKGNKTKIAALSLALVALISSPAFAKSASAADDTKTSVSTQAPCEDKKCHKPDGFFKTFEALGLTKEDIEAARKSGKTIFDLAKEKKGLSPEQVKDIMIKSKTEHINKKVSEGKITKEKADEIITKMKERMKNWDGKLKDKSKS
ncbi:YckD family protein [Clostridium sp. SYSU_GA19001]|uniref:YckD family protein n=1 Tax=Clostridium caldaquaticum TaxID=2940653 RepID=UPI002077180F|nr:YckD family protein [Clostridium caldaquaticum]MCM8712062.1 YckD family protein [Clostridium caldaquaticum]